MAAAPVVETVVDLAAVMAAAVPAVAMAAVVPVAVPAAAMAAVVPVVALVVVPGQVQVAQVQVELEPVRLAELVNLLQLMVPFFRAALPHLNRYLT